MALAVRLHKPEGSESIEVIPDARGLESAPNPELVQSCGPELVKQREEDPIAVRRQEELFVDFILGNP